MSMLSFADREKRVDTVLITVATLFLLCSGFLILDDTFLFQNIMVQKQQSQQNPIATLTSPQNDVRKKAPSDLVWIPITSSTRIIERDTIFTGANSSAIVKFDDGTEFTLEPESMVIIEKKEDQANVEVARGGVSGKLGKNVKLKAQGNDNFELSSDSGAEINLNMAKGGGPKVDVLSGDADFNTKTGKKKIAQNQTVEFGKGSISSVKKHLVDLISPSVNLEVLMSPKQKIEFKWKALTSADNYQFELSKTRNFDGKYFKKLTNKLNFKIPRPKKEGDYYWRVKIYSKGQLLSESLPRKFNVIHEKPPQIMLPNNNEVIKHPYLYEYINDYSKALFEVNLKWLTSFNIEKSEILIANDKKFKKVVKSSKLEQTFLAEKLKPGKYFWKVRLNDSSTIKRTWSKVANFEIQVIKSKKIPRLISPIKKQVHNMFDFSIVIGLQWEELSDIQEYHLEISKSIKFEKENIIVKEVLGDNEFSWSTELKDTFYWRIRTVSKEGVVSQYSKPESFIIKDPPPPTAPEIKEETLEKEFGKLSPPNQKFDLFSFFIANSFAEDEEIVTAVDLEWAKVERAVKYKIEISPTRKFTKIIHEHESSKTSYTWKHDQVGTYYWRVRAIDKKGIIGIPSKPGTIKLRFGEPEPFGENDFRYDINNESIVHSSTQIKLEWTTGKFAYKYQVQLADNRSFRNSKRIYAKKNFLMIDIDYGKKYYWRVRSIDKQGRIGSNYSKIKLIQAKPIINDYFTILVSPLDATKFRYTETQQAPILFKWKPVPFADKYEIEISQDKYFETVRLRKITKNTHFKYVGESPLRPTYYWRVRAINEHSTAIWSDTYTFNIISNENLDIPQIIYPTPNTFKGQNEMADVYFEWKDVEEALSYVIELGVDKDFKFGKRVFLASNANAVIKLKTRSTYYYRIRSSYIIPVDTNVSELKNVPTKGIGPVSKMHEFILNKGYSSKINLEIGFSNYSYTNDISSSTANLGKGSGSNTGNEYNLSYTWFPQFLGGNLGLGIGVEEGSSKLQYVDQDNSAAGEFAYRQSDTRLFLNYRTSLSRVNTFEFSVGVAKVKRSYPYLNSISLFESRFADETYLESDFSFRWLKKKNYFHRIGIMSGVSTNASMYYMPWYEMKFFRNSSWYGFKVKYKSHTVNYKFDSTLPQSDSFNINSTSILFVTGIGF